MQQSKLTMQGAFQKLLGVLGSSPSKNTQQHRQQPQAIATAGEDDNITMDPSNPSLSAMVSVSTSGEPGVSSLSSASSSSSAADSSMLLKRQLEMVMAENRRLKMKVSAGRRIGKGMVGRGKNKQTVYHTDTTDIPNKFSLQEGVATTVWPAFKFLYFKGRWNEYDPQKPHHFAAHVMKFVTVPPEYKGRDHKYYEEFVLPNVSSKLSSLRSNFVTMCGKAFKSESSMFRLFVA